MSDKKHGVWAVQSYSYDSLNRIKDATEVLTPSGGSATQTWKQTYTFDRYGNRRFDFTGGNTTFPASTCTEAICDPTISTSNNRITSSGWATAIQYQVTPLPRNGPGFGADERRGLRKAGDYR